MALSFSMLLGIYFSIIPEDALTQESETTYKLTNRRVMRGMVFICGGAGNDCTQQGEWYLPYHEY